MGQPGLQQAEERARKSEERRIKKGREFSEREGGRGGAGREERKPGLATGQAGEPPLCLAATRPPRPGGLVFERKRSKQ